MTYQIINQDGNARSAHMETVHGVIETPVFMNVGTAAAIKGAVSTMDLHEIGSLTDRNGCLVTVWRRMPEENVRQHIRVRQYRRKRLRQKYRKLLTAEKSTDRLQVGNQRLQNRINSRPRIC